MHRIDVLTIPIRSPCGGRGISQLIWSHFVIRHPNLCKITLVLNVTVSQSSPTPLLGCNWRHQLWEISRRARNLISKASTFNQLCFCYLRKTTLAVLFISNTFKVTFNSQLILHRVLSPMILRPVAQVS